MSKNNLRNSYEFDIESHDEDQFNAQGVKRKMTWDSSPVHDSSTDNPEIQNKKPKLAGSIDSSSQTDLEPEGNSETEDKLMKAAESLSLFTTHLNQGDDYEAKLQKVQISKTLIRYFLESVYSTEMSSKVLADITGDNFISVGRSQVNGSSKKQMRHVTPHSFLEKLISENVKSYSDKKSLITSLASYINILISDRKGACVEESLLKTEPYTDIEEGVRNASSKSITENGERCFLISPNKKDKALATNNPAFTPTKIAKVTKDFSQKNTKFTQIAINKLITSIGESDENTLNLVAEGLCRLLFTIFNARPGAAYPSEGNTLEYEIRYYKNIKDAKAGNKEYEVMTSREIKEMIDKGEKLNQKLRFVDAEGPRVQKVKVALDVLNKAVSLIDKRDFIEDLNSNIKNYNTNYNDPIKLTNSNYSVNDKHLGKYNNNLKGKDLSANIYLHIAKQLFLVFDYKALEDDVLVGFRKGEIKAYMGAKGDSKVKCGIKSGSEYREDKYCDRGDKYNHDAIFRNKEKFDLKNLAKKIVEHVSISLFSYETFKSCFNHFNQVLEDFSSLICMEYKLADDKCSELLEISQDQSKKYFDIFSVGDSKDATIAFKGNEFIEVIGEQGLYESHI